MVDGPVTPRRALRRILIDGGSGAGKTTMATRLGQRWSQWCGEPVQVVSLDSFYPGWYGLEAASRMVCRDVLRERAPGYRRWDWSRGEPLDWVGLDPTRPMVVEGCGAITRESAALADLTIWVELDLQTRRRRALSRPDADGYRAWWDVWAAQEEEHWRRHHPQELADLVVRPGVPDAVPETGIFNSSVH